MLCAGDSDVLDPVLLKEAASACLANAYGAGAVGADLTERCLLRAYEAAGIPIPDPAAEDAVRCAFDGEVEALLGRGTFSAVYRVRAPGPAGSDRRFARKTVDLEGFGENDRRKLSEEGSILRRLDHPFILRCFAVANTARHAVCVLELAEMNLGAFLEARRPDAAWTLRLLAQLAQALRYLERACVLHRDLKPGNVLLFEDGAVAKLGDFGSSRLLLGSSGFESATPYYMAPESLSALLGRGLGTYSDATDRWALGCVVYEVAAGARPFEASNWAALARKVADGDYAPLPEAAAALAAVTAGLLQVEPQNRWTLDEVLDSTAVRPYVVPEPPAPGPLRPLEAPLALVFSGSASVTTDSWENAGEPCTPRGIGDSLDCTPQAKESEPAPFVVVSPAPPAESPVPDGSARGTPNIACAAKILGVAMDRPKRGRTYNTGNFFNELKVHVHVDRRTRSVSPAWRRGAPDGDDNDDDDVFSPAGCHVPVAISRDSTRSMTG